jgi:hypothetical protein
MATIEEGAPVVERVRTLDHVIFGVQPIVPGSLAALRALASSTLLTFSGINVGYGWPEWSKLNLSTALRQPVTEWLQVEGHLGWEISTGLALWLAAFVGSSQDQVQQWFSDFSAKSTAE